MTNDNTPKEPSEADLDAMLAQIDADLATTLERCAELPLASQEFGKRYADAQHRMRRTLAMFQFEHALTDRTQYRQILLALASDLVCSGLEAEAKTMGKSQRTSIYLKHQAAVFKRLVRIGAIVEPSPGNQKRVLDANGQPVRRRH